MERGRRLLVLDLSGLNKIAYKGFETAEEQEARDELLNAGYTIVDPPENPFTAQSSAPQEPADGTERISPHPTPTGGTAAKTEPNTGISGQTTSASMREAWGMAYRLYARCAPALRAAAADPDGESKAGDIFLQAAEEIRMMASAGEDGEIMGAALLDMLDDVWQRAQAGQAA